MATVQAKTIVAQLTCDAGHKHHKNGPCPESAEGKVARMAGKHHPKTGAKGTPKSRHAKRAADALASVKGRMGKKDGDGPGGAGAGGGGVTV
jgi:hypothetical protein